MSHEIPSITFADQVRSTPGGEFLEMCYSCGTCTTKCMIQQKLDSEYNPRRLLRLVMMEMKDEAFSDITTWLCSECDLCYPACPQKIHISGVITAVKSIAVSEGNKTTVSTAIVEQQTCVGCGLCAEACPYDAITIVETKIPYRGSIQIAKVDPGLCMSCGICSAICRSTSIRIPDHYSDEVLMDNLWNWLIRQGVN